MEIEDIIKLFLGVITLIGVMYTAYLAFQSKKEATETNDAVNHRPAGSPKLYDLAQSTHDDVIRLQAASDYQRAVLVEQGEVLQKHGAKLATHELLLDRANTSLEELKFKINSVN